MVICNVDPGFERPNPWVVNLRAQPRAQVQIGRDTITVRARPVSENELDRYWPRLAKLWPACLTFYDRGASDRFSCSSRMRLGAKQVGEFTCYRAPLRCAGVGDVHLGSDAGGADSEQFRAEGLWASLKG